MRLPAKGDRVIQPNYGAGTVMSADVHHTVIDFDEHGLRRFVTDRVSLEPTTTPPPTPSARRAARAAKKRKEKAPKA